MAPRASDENQRIKDERREMIMAAASELFAHRGLAATRISDIASAAGMSLGLIYHYFENKEQLFNVLVTQAINGLSGIYRRILEEEEGTPWDKLYRLAEIMLDSLQHKPQLYMVVLQALTSEAAPTELRQMIVESSEANARMLRQLVIEGQEAGQMVKGDPDQLVILFYMCIQGYAVDRAFFSHLKPRDLTVDNLLRILKSP